MTAAPQPQGAVTWWLTGLPGAGKTTLAQALAASLRAQGTPVCILDGDELRAGLCQDLGFDEASRSENVRRVAHLASLLNSNAINAVVAMISPSASARAAAYSVIGPERCKEIYVCTPLEVCELRDPKGLYALARANPLAQLTGIQARYEPPQSPALRIDTSTVALNEAVQLLLHV